VVSPPGGVTYSSPPFFLDEPLPCRTKGVLNKASCNHRSNAALLQNASQTPISGFPAGPLFSDEVDGGFQERRYSPAEVLSHGGSCFGAEFVFSVSLFHSMSILIFPKNHQPLSTPVLAEAGPHHTLIGLLHPPCEKIQVLYLFPALFLSIYCASVRRSRLLADLPDRRHRFSLMVVPLFRARLCYRPRTVT